MKSTSPFNWQAQPATLFTKKEKQTMKQFITTKSIDRKAINFYQKAKPAKDL
jgi:hypothetical protein